MVRISSDLNLLTENEVAKLTGICSDHLRGVVRTYNLGTLIRAKETAASMEARFFTHSEVMILTVLQPRCEHSSGIERNRPA